MKLQIMILNTMKYQKEGETNYKSRLAYIIPTLEAFSDNAKFRGYTELSSYRNDDKFYELIPKDFIGQKCDITITELPSKNNPLKTWKQITEVSCNGKTTEVIQYLEKSLIHFNIIKNCLFFCL